MARSKLLSKIRTEVRRKNYSYHKEQAYIGWMIRFVYYHNLEHPKNLREAEVVDYLNHLVVDRKVSYITQAQAKHAIRFFYEHVIREPLNQLEGIQLAKDVTHIKFTA